MKPIKNFISIKWFTDNVIIDTIGKILSGVTIIGITFVVSGFITASKDIKEIPSIKKQIDHIQSNVNNHDQRITQDSFRRVNDKTELKGDLELIQLSIDDIKEAIGVKKREKHHK